MQLMRAKQALVVGLTVSLTCVSSSPAQSLGEVARQERARKKAAKPQQRVVTNEELNSAGKGKTAAQSREGETAQAAAAKPVRPQEEKSSAAELQAKIKAQKEKVRALEAKIREAQKRLDARNAVGTLTVDRRVVIQPGGWGSGPSPCDRSNAMHSNPYKEWCEEPAKLQTEIEKDQSKLAEEKAALEALQEEARRLGYGSAFYDPD